MTTDLDTINHVNETTAIFDDIDKILANYDDTGGSKNTSMAQLRTQVASIYPYEDPNFLYHWSSVARAAINLDARANRLCFPLTYEWPENPDPQSIPPIVLSGRLSPPPTIDVYGVIEGFFDRPIQPSPSRFEDLSMFPSNPITNSGKAPPPPPLLPQAFSVGARTPSPPAVDPPPTQGPSLLHHITFSKSPWFPQNPPVTARSDHPTISRRTVVKQQPIPSCPIFERIDKGKRKRDSSFSSSRSSIPPFITAPAVSGIPGHPGLSSFVPAPAVSGAPATSGIPAFAGPFTGAITSAPYLDDNEHLVPKEFSPVSFQFYGAVASSDPPQSRLRINADGDLKNVEGSAPKEITDNNHWQNLLTVLKHAYIAAFPPAAVSIKSYFDYILSLPGLFQARVHWEDTTSTNPLRASTTKFFTAQPENWAVQLFLPPNILQLNPLLEPLGSPLKQLLLPASLPLAPLLRSREVDESSPSIKFATPKLFLWLISLVITGMLACVPTATMTATEYTGYATKMDALRIIREASLTNEPNARTFLRGLEIDVLSKGYSAAVESSIHAAPLPSAPPLSSDPLAAYAIKRRPDLFQINCSINVKNLQSLLKNHPNKPFVDSIIVGLTDGFWPISSLPSDDTVFNKNHATGPEAEEVLTKTRDKEVKLNRFSLPFYTLLPGMKVSPLCLATNPTSGKVCMCTNMSFANPSPNDLIEKEDIQIDLDGIPYFIPFMLYHYFGKHKFILWKSDVDAAF
ncbi:uncharacterized protein MELLADRAFT_95985 [Melampsora larici-populina 98AG31]|uniref:Uncharacterized protein n=1 Tax=Melampsora larici-populina (strain 98AG31 / pathotype 3-4-7) TaxID=747676 RepID=F4RE01_MELLP|nr:uncharacterized protein MELLADRAFT_95985 [Melampsora larici-populina 98AG31]EGG09524.1 hypothetical protein MELLADRAFT_95985 [Melampsora larici-populina 98AG31]